MDLKTEIGELITNHKKLIQSHEDLIIGHQNLVSANKDLITANQNLIILLTKLNGSKEKSTDNSNEEWLNLNQLCQYLPDKPAKATVYGWVHHRLIPCHKGGRNLRFLKSEINMWLKQGKKSTISEINEEVDNFLASQKKSNLLKPNKINH